MQYVPLDLACRAIVIPNARGITASYLKNLKLSHCFDDVYGYVLEQLGKRIRYYDCRKGNSLRDWAKYRTVDAIRDYFRLRIGRDRRDQDKALIIFIDLNDNYIEDFAESSATGNTYDEEEFRDVLWNDILPKIISYDDIALLKAKYIDGLKPSEIARLIGRPRIYVARHIAASEEKIRAQAERDPALAMELGRS